MNSTLQRRLTESSGVLFLSLSVLFAGCAPPLPATNIRFDPPIYATPQRVIDAMLELAGTTKDDIVYDLGSGGGHIVITAAKDFGARAVGIEWKAHVVKSARKRAKRANVASRASFIHADIFAADFSEATVVTMYLYEDINRRLKPHLLKQLGAGTRIVTQTYVIPGWIPEKQINAGGKMIYLYTIPPKVQAENTS